MTRTIDLNADLGEDESPAGIARDIAIMDIVTSCNIACGGHAGSPESMRIMLAAAKSRHIAPGAHPSYPDRPGFGRQSMDISLEDLEACCVGPQKLYYINNTAVETLEKQDICIHL